MAWLGTGIAPPGTHPIPSTPGTPPPCHPSAVYPRAASPRTIKCRGAQIGSSTHLRCPFLGFRGMTEVYNLSLAGNPNDHKCIAGKE